MSFSPIDTDTACVAIAEDSAGLADVAGDNLDARIEHCPDWSVADLVAHVTDVHWFWGTIVDERLAAPPDDSRRPARAPDDQLLAAFLAGAERLVMVLRDADPGDAVWTWAPGFQTVGFVTRHQVQEAAVHHWDAANAAGRQLVIDPGVAADAVDEFLTVSVSSDADPAEPPRPALDGSFILRCTDIDAGWRVTDGQAEGTVAATSVAPDEPGPALAASASDLLLWLYRRVTLAPGAVGSDVLDRFRALTFTD